MSLWIKFYLKYCLYFAVFGNDENQPGLDLSEFPSLSNRGTLPNSSVSSIRNYGK
jgi:hypothetical protein